MKPCCLISTNALKVICFVAGLCSIASTLQADDDFEHPPISYQDSPSRDPVARLLERDQSGEESLVPDENASYLKSLLHALKSKPPQGVRLSEPELDSIRMMLSEFKPGWLEEDPL